MARWPQLNNLRRVAFCWFPLLTMAALACWNTCHAADTEAWRGFRGLEQQGRQLDATPPVFWSESSNIIWRTAIPGSGHSSPVVMGKQAYVTTACTSERIARILEWISRCTTLLACVLIILGVWPLVRLLSTRGTKWEVALAHAQALAFAGLLLFSSGVVLFGESLFDLGTHELRTWKISAIAVLCSILLGALQAPSSSAWWRAAGLVALASVLPLYFQIEPKDELFPFFSRQQVKLKVLLLAPLGLGLLLVMANELRRGGASRAGVVVEPPPRIRDLAVRLVLISGIASLASGVFFFLTAYRKAGRSLENLYLGPATSWWWAIGAGTLALALAAQVIRRQTIRTEKDKPWLIGVFAVTAWTLAALHFLQYNYFARQESLVYAVVCLDADTGKIRWLTEGPNAGGDKILAPNSPATPTPALDSERVYAYFGSAGLMCADHQGKLLWINRDLPSRGMYGPGTSPVLDGNQVILGCENAAGAEANPEVPSYLAAVEGRSGRLLWRRELPRSERKAETYATPLLGEFGGTNLILMQSWKEITAYAAGGGEARWRMDLTHGGRHLVASLSAGSGRVYAVTGKQVVALDFAQATSGPPAFRWTQAISGEKASTPVEADGLLFLVTEEGVAYCLDAANGAVQWRQRLKGSHYAAVIAAGDYVYFTNEHGQTTVMTRSRSLNVVATNKLGHQSYATPTPVGDRLYLRHGNTVYCVRSPGSGPG